MGSDDSIGQSAGGGAQLHVTTALAGAPLELARGVAVLVHGRNQDEQVMLDLAERLERDRIHYLIPVVAGRSWYGGRYFDPAAGLEAELARAIAAVEAVIETAPGAGVLLCGFSQGGCLVAELAARNPRGLAAVAILTGSLVGARGERTTPVAVDGLPVYVSCGAHDEWVSPVDAEQTADAFKRAGARVAFETLDEREHAISDGAVAGVRALLDELWGSLSS